jgi:hypothetical protein
MSIQMGTPFRGTGAANCCNMTKTKCQAVLLIDLETRRFESTTVRRTLSARQTARTGSPENCAFSNCSSLNSICIPWSIEIFQNDQSEAIFPSFMVVFESPRQAALIGFSFCREVRHEYQDSEMSYDSIIWIYSPPHCCR